MALSDCIQKALRAKRITPKQAEEIQRLAGESPNETEFLELFIQEAQEAKRRLHLQVIASKRNLADVKAHPDGVGRGVLALLTRDIEGKAPYSNVDYRRRAILAEFHSQIAEAMSAYRTKNLGFTQDASGIRRMVKELFGEASGDQDAARFARMWSDTAEAARLRFNVAGGNIQKRQDWGLPHVHDARKIAAVSFDEWRDLIVPKLDRKRMFNKLGQPMSDRQFGELLQNVYQQSVDRGLRTDTATPRGVPNERTDHRLLTFKDSTSWLEYNERFGESDVYHALTTHLDHLAGDIALMEILGPNPDAAFRHFTELAAREKTPHLTMKLIRDVYEVVTGRINQTDNDFIGNLGTGVRNWLSSAQLGSAFVSSFSDVWTNRMTAKMLDLPFMPILREMFSQMRPGNQADRVFAVKLGLGAEAWITRALAASRFQEITGTGIAARISDTVFRATLLSPWTDAGRKAFGMEFLSFVADNAAKDFKALPELLRNGFERYGITAAHWNIIRQAPVLEERGAKYLRPQDILELSRGEAKRAAEIFREAAKDIEAEQALRGERSAALGRRLREGGKKAESAQEAISFIREAANRLQEMVLTEMDFAVPMPDARVRAIVTQGSRRGSIIGELARSVTLYKQFPITIVSTHLYRGASQVGALSKGKYFAELLLGLTVMGAIAHQTKQIVKGRDPQDMTKPEFWAAAFAQGGGAGIYGDFIQASESRFGKSFTSTLAGPVFGLVDDSVNLTLGNLHQFIQDKETNFAREAIRFAERYTPGSNAWYLRLAVERLLWDRLLELADPEAHQSFRRVMQKTRRDYGQEFWWRPGEIAPGRGPNIESSTGE